MTDPSVVIPGYRGQPNGVMPLDQNGLVPDNFANVGASTNVKAYGATGNGVTDDSVAIQNAINSLGQGGGIVYFPVGVYLINTPLTSSAQNVQVVGDGWSLPHPGETNDAMLGTPLSLIQQGPSFPSNNFLLTLNNTTNMLIGCSVSNIAFKGIRGSNNVGAVHWGNAAFCWMEYFDINDMSGSAVLTDQANFAYPIPSTSQMWYNNFTINNCGGNGIDFGPNIFASDFYISHFWMSQLNNGVNIGSNNASSFSFYIHDGTMDRCQQAVASTSYDTHIHHLNITGSYKHGIYVKSVQPYGYQSHITDCIIRDSDQNQAGYSDIFLDTGTHNYVLDGNLCSKVNANCGENGITIVDGEGVNGNFIMPNNISAGHTVSNFKFGATLITDNRYVTFKTIARMAAGTTGGASLNIPSGVAPTAPNDGDVWYDGTNIKIRVGGTTKTFTIT